MALGMRVRVRIDRIVLDGVEAPGGWLEDFRDGLREAVAERIAQAPEGRRSAFERLAAGGGGSGVGRAVAGQLWSPARGGAK
jgi:hypothetical protein